MGKFEDNLSGLSFVNYVQLVSLVLFIVIQTSTSLVLYYHFVSDQLNILRLKYGFNEIT